MVREDGCACTLCSLPPSRSHKLMSCTHMCEDESFYATLDKQQLV